MATTIKSSKQEVEFEYENNGLKFTGNVFVQSNGNKGVNGQINSIMGVFVGNCSTVINEDRVYKNMDYASMQEATIVPAFIEEVNVQADAIIANIVSASSGETESEAAPTDTEPEETTEQTE